MKNQYYRKPSSIKNDISSIMVVYTMFFIVCSLIIYVVKDILLN
jgi:hypothetical protein